jgi:hypothetical protein
MDHSAGSKIVDLLRECSLVSQANRSRVSCSWVSPIESNHDIHFCSKSMHARIQCLSLILTWMSILEHEMRSGHCRVLNATTTMCDNFVWLSRVCVPGGVRSKKAIRTSLFLCDCAHQRACSTRFHTQRRSGSSFPCQSLALELIPSGSRPNN